LRTAYKKKEKKIGQKRKEKKKEEEVYVRLGLAHVSVCGVLFKGH
jgi:hypothetical protein